MKEICVELCRKEIQRIAWRIQYRQRLRYKMEILVSVDESLFLSDPMKQISSKLFVQEVLKNIPSSKGRYIINRLIIDGCTEKEIADELNISQQAVSKWKKKSLQQISQQICYQQ